MGLAKRVAASACLALVLGACGPDAGGLVTVTVIDNGEPVAGAKLIYAQPDGTILATVDTGNDGKAVHEIPSEAVLTAAYTVPGDHRLMTVFGVKPGDNLVLGNRGAEQVGMVNVTPPPNAPSGVVTRRYYTGARITSTATAVPVVQDGVDGQHRFNLLAKALDTNNAVLAFANAQNVDITSGDATVTSGAWSWTAPDTSRISFTGVAPRGADNLLTETALFQDTRVYDREAVTGSATAPVMVTLPAPADFGDSQVAGAIVSFPSSTDEFFFYSGLTTRGAVRGAQTMDLSSLMPRVHDPVVTTSALTTTVTWMSDSAITGASGGGLVLTWNEPPGGGGVFHWAMLFPPDVTTASVTLPTDLASYKPNGQPIGATFLGVVKASSADTYDKFRPAYTRFLDLTGNGDVAFVGDGPQGTFSSRVTYLNHGPF